MSYSRRQIMLAMTVGAAILHGKATASQTAQGVRRQILLALDATDDIIIRYRGRQVVLTPAEILDSLGAK